MALALTPAIRPPCCCAATLLPEMAETMIIEHHLPSLLGSPSMDLDGTQDSGDYGYDDSEFPYAPGVLHGVKCCSKCGATKTPQWREGPCGPKTLCNACGVKRTRKLRAETDGAKRRKMTASPAGKAYAKAPKAAAAAYAQDDGYGSLDYDDGYPESAFYHPSAAALRRPARRAAEEAAAKTARYARSGDYGAYHGAPAAAALATPTSSSDYSLPSSDCPEEVSWTPLAAEAAARGGMPLDCYAAVNLMTMSAADGSPVSGRPLSAAASLPEPAPLAAAAPPEADHAAAAAAAAQHAQHGAKPTAADLEELYKSLPPAKVAELVRLNEALDGSVQAAAGAGAAVAAVAAVLAAKQAAALRARELAVAATKRLRRFMLELDTQFGVPPRGLPRIRTSPTKTASA
jgi:hypothetical protein